MIWFISDTHFGHRNLEREDYGSRPEDFECSIVDHTVGRFAPTDTLVHVGDVAIGRDGKAMATTWLRALPCSKVLVRGNHDRESYAAYLRQGWDAVMDGAIFVAYGRSFIVTHEPMGDVPLDFNIHGHLHNSGHRGELVNDGRHILIACEHCDYRPVSIKTLAALGGTPVWRKDRWEKL